MKRKAAPALFGPNDEGRDMRPIAELRGAMASRAESIAIPARFDCDLSRAPMIRITDLDTGRAVDVPLCSYGDVRRALAALFG